MKTEKTIIQEPQEVEKTKMKNNKEWQSSGKEINKEHLVQEKQNKIFYMTEKKKK